MSVDGRPYPLREIIGHLKDAVRGRGVAEGTAERFVQLVQHLIVFISGKHGITMRGEDRDETVIAAVNNDKAQPDPATGKGRGTKYRFLVGVESSDDFTLERMTLHNLTPQGGSQAEALRIDGGRRSILRDATFRSLQDTVLFNSPVYVADSTIEGNVDYVWGKGPAFFERCQVKTVGRKGYTVQARNPEGQLGFVFVDCTLTGEPGITGHLLARIDTVPSPGKSAYPFSAVAFIDCRMDGHIAPVGWQAKGGFWASLRLHEYGSRDLAGQSVDVSQRLPASRQIGDAEADELRDPAHVPGGWNPRGPASP